MKNLFILTLVLLLCSSSWTVIAQGPAPPCTNCGGDPDPGDEEDPPPPPDYCDYGPPASNNADNYVSFSQGEAWVTDGKCKGYAQLKYVGTPPSHPDDVIDWYWYKDGERIGLSKNANTHTIYSGGTYSLKQEWRFCQNPDKFTFGSIVVSSDHITPVPSVNITKSESTSCVGQSVSLTANTSNFGSNPTYAWRQNGVGSVLHTGKTFKIPEDEYVTPGNKSFTVTVTGVSTCNGVSKTDTESIQIPGTLSSLEFLGGGKYCNEQADEVELYIQDAHAQRSHWMKYEFEIWKSTNGGSSYARQGGRYKGINHDDVGDGKNDNSTYDFKLTFGKFGEGKYKLKIIKSGCIDVWDENIITTEAETFQTVSLLPGSEYIYKCEGVNYVEIYTNHEDAMLYNLHSSVTPIAGLDYSGSSIKGVLPACDFNCDYYVGLPAGYCVSTTKKKVAFRNVEPPLPPRVLATIDQTVECEGSEITLNLSVDQSYSIVPPVDHPESFPIEETTYPVKYKWYKNGVNLVNATTGPSLSQTLPIGSYNYKVSAYSTLCEIEEEGPQRSFDQFTIDFDKPKPDAPVLENLTTCFTGTAELKASGFEAYTWYKDGSTSGITETGSELSFALESSNLGTYKVSAKYGDDPACVTDFSNTKTVALFTESECDDYLNHVTARTFGIDEAGNEIEIAASKNYFDLAGASLQSQSTTYDANGVKQVMATQTIKDTYGREVLQTLPAALNRTDFLYNHEFVTKADGQDEVRYESTHFDGARKNSPDPVAQGTPGTLGWYYSASNSLEDNVPETAYPYTRTDFYEDGSGEVKRSAAPGESLHMGSGHESITKTLPVGNQGQELKHYDALRKLVLNLDAIPNLDRVYKQISIDPDDKEVVSYQTEEGTIATAIVKDGITEITYSANAEGEVEIHIPKGGLEVALSGRTGEFKVYDKIADENDITGSLATGNSVNLGEGIYKLSGVSSASYTPGYAEYSYNIYDNAGRLAASIAPLGVEKILASGVPATREALTYTTFYYYDYQGRLIEMDEPDAGVTKYLYRRDGSIRFSENELQREQNRFSYTCYDVSGRPVESGEYTGADTYASRNVSSVLEQTGWSGYDTERTDWVETYYDLVYENGDDSLHHELATYMDTWYSARYTSGHGYPTDVYAAHYMQDFLEGAVSYTKNEDVTTWYSYDEFGQVTFIVMKYENMGTSGQYFTIDYTYDYFGNVTEVAYQKHFIGESFYHHYEYNDNQQLVKVYTSQAGEDDPYKYLHATYHYYLHGPLKRIELAEDLQGLDYTYTAQGWLKAINSPANNLDPGGDGNNGFFHDAFGMEIDYYNNDHQSDQFSSVNPEISADDQYSGNIRAITWGRQGTANDEEFEYLEETFNEALTADVNIETRNLVTLEEGFDSNGFAFDASIDPRAVKGIPLEIDAQQYEYTYDFKNQLAAASYTDAVASAATDDRYAVKGLSYDANGNIQTLQRHDETAALADDFTYDYNYEANTNQLEKVDDAVDSSIYSSYEYNAIGQMTAAIGRGDYGDQYFDYDVTGKVTGIYSDAAHNTELVSYEYDDRGFRIRKSIKDGPETWYVRDASGNIIAIYEKEGTGLALSELPIYGSGKIGTSFRDPLKHKYSYELTDHLGNVRSVISKLKFYEVATIETENQFTEASIWENVTNESLRDMDMMFNTTNINGNEKYSVRLDGSNSAVGPALSRAVQKGDKISFHAQAMYVDGFTSTGLADDMFGLIAGAYGVTSGGETQAIYDGLNAAVASASGFLATPPSGVPKAYIQCLVFDKDFNDITPSEAHAMVSSNAAGNASSAEEIGTEIEITEDGYIYLYVANETKDAQVHFDDITVSVLGFDISEMTDYYPFGSVASHWEKEPYRFGYQGQFAEEDEETGFNHFEAREYDATIGRWMAVDPHRQFASPYLGMGNNWMNGVDRDGRDWWKNKFGGEHWFDHTPDANDWTHMGGTDYRPLDGYLMNEVTITNNFVIDAVLDGREKAAPIVAIPVMLAGGMALSGGAIIATKLWAAKASTSAGLQYALNGGNVDFADVAFDAVLTPGMSSALGAIIDVKSNGVNVIGGDKSFENAMLDYSVGASSSLTGSGMQPLLNKTNGTDKLILQSMFNLNNSAVHQSIGVYIKSSNNAR
ncbi:RHS repeat-associated core domain-containing protein [Reichenbachiella sp.]